MIVNKKQNGISPMVAAVTGAVVGGIAVAGVVANREKVKEVLSNIKGHAEDYIDDVQQQAENTQNDVEEVLVEGKEKVKKVANAM